MKTTEVSGETAGAGGGQYLTFALGDEEYALEILAVQEIRGYTAITPIPNVPPWIRGVMNLRGAVVPVIELRRRFALPEADYDKFSVIIVVNVRGRVVGLLVDAVSDVLNIQAGEVDDASGLVSGAEASYVSGIARSGERIIALLDVDQVVGAHDA